MLLQIDSKQMVKWATVLFTPDIGDILYCSVVKHYEKECKYYKKWCVELSHNFSPIDLADMSV